MYFLIAVKKRSGVGTFFGCVFFFGVCSLFIWETASQFTDPAPSPILFSDGKTLAEVIFDENGIMLYCRLHELEEPSDADVIVRSSGLPVEYPKFKNMLHLINNCTQLAMPSVNSTESSTNDSTEMSNNLWAPWSLWNGIVPGTKWCGVGDIADTFEELGSQANVDACCRAHDHCPVKLKAFRAGYGLINLSLYTKSHCDCDKDFYGCLKTSSNELADMVGNFYFNFMRAQCIKEHRPYICVENSTEINGNQHCIRWSPDPNTTKMRVTLSQLKY